MADPSGFLKFNRQGPARRPIPLRLRDWHEVYEPFDDQDLRGPGGPLHGLRNPVLPSGLSAGQHHPGVERPGPHRQVGGGVRPAARHQQLPGVHRPALPGAVRGGLRARHR